LDDCPHLAQRSRGSDGETEHLGDLAQQHSERDTIHVPVTDRLREQLGDKAELRETSRDTHDAGDDRHHAGERDRALRIARRERQDDGQNHRSERGVRA
jgi:hypothetical protein